MIRQEVVGEVARIFWETKPLFPLATDKSVERDEKFRITGFQG